MEEFTIPEKLREIPHPPEKLYIRGIFPRTEKYLAVVGSRKYSDYGERSCEHLIKGLSGRSITIVSGLALGIDTISHLAALNAHLPTIAFPGSGLDDRAIAPSSHVEIAHRIISENGCLISEYGPMTPGAVWTFPARNRLMAGIADAILVIEAGRQSGTLITARMALDYNKTLCVVPGSIFNPTSEGSNDLIKLGATPIMRSEDIVEALGMKTDGGIMAKKNIDAILERLKEICSEQELTIISNLFEPKSRDELGEILGMPIVDLNIALSLLELKDLIEERYGKLHLTLR